MDVEEWELLPDDESLAGTFVMDVEEWELLPDDGSLKMHDDGGKEILSRKYGGDPKSAFWMDHFTIPPQKSEKLANTPEDQLVSVPIQLQQAHQGHLELSELSSEKIKANDLGGALETDQDTASQVFFKKTKEKEFVDMKIGSPKLSAMGIYPHIDAGMFKDSCKSETMEGKTGSKIKIEKETVTKKSSLDSESNADMNIWKRSLTGIGAICSFTVAAATICIVIFGSHKRNKQMHLQNQKHPFEIHADDKRIKQVVYQATQLDEYISRSQQTRAHNHFCWLL